MTNNTDPLSQTFASVARELARLLPADVKAECDAQLDDQASPRDIWMKYDMALSNLRNSQREQTA